MGRESFWTSLFGYVVMGIGADGGLMLTIYRFV